MTKEDAASLFDQRAQSQSARKYVVPGEQPRLAIMDIPRTKVYRKREFSNTLASSSAIESRAQADGALGQLAQIGVGASSFTGPAF